jgi:hypothetical protein
VQPLHARTLRRRVSHSLHTAAPRQSITGRGKPAFRSIMLSLERQSLRLLSQTIVGDGKLSARHGAWPTWERYRSDDKALDRSSDCYLLAATLTIGGKHGLAVPMQSVHAALEDGLNVKLASCPSLHRLPAFLTHPPLDLLCDPASSNRFHSIGTPMKQ